MLTVYRQHNMPCMAVLLTSKATPKHTDLGCAPREVMKAAVWWRGAVPGRISGVSNRQNEKVNCEIAFLISRADNLVSIPILKGGFVS